MTSHTVTERQAKELAARITALNNAQSALQQYFSAVADGLGLPEGTTLVRVEDTTLVVDGGT